MYKLTILALLLATGCAVESLDVGGDENAGGTDGGNTGGSSSNTGDSSTGAAPSGGVGHAPGTPPPVMPLPNRDGCGTDSEFAAFVGTWEGGEYDFDFTLVRRVRLEINGISAAGGICGTMLYGEEMPVPPVDDPDAMYPYTGASVSPQRTWDGFVYTVVSGGAQGSSLHVGLNGSEVWAPWCEAQSPVFDSEGNAYDSCVPNLGSGEVSSTTCRLFNNEVSVEYPPAKCALCARSPVCACDAERCGVSWLHGIQITFELVTEGGTLKLTDGKMPPMRQTVLERVD